MGDSEEKKYETTQEHFEFFKECALKWKEQLGLHDWSLIFVHTTQDKVEELNGNKAIVAMSRGGMNAKCTLNKDWSEVEPTKQRLNSCALHEMLEMVLHPLLVLTRTRFNVDELDVEYEQHRIIRKLETLLVGEHG